MTTTFRSFADGFEHQPEVMQMTKIDRLRATPNTASSPRLVDRPPGMMPFSVGSRAARRQRARVVVFAFGLLSAVFAAIMILRIVVRLPLFHP
jgi:hypothetical protein